jgi:superfamily I DNA and RNA helicase
LVKAQYGRDLVREMAAAYPREDKWMVQYPECLAESVDILPDRFGAIVVDEGQDFIASWWNSILLLLHDPDKDPVIAFYDPNQCLYNCSDIPFKDSIFALTINCRNTEAIHKAAYRFYEGTPTDPPDIAGTPLELCAAPDLATQAGTIRRRVAELMDAGVDPQDITVLIGIADKDGCYRALRALQLPNKARWMFEGHQQSGAVRVDTVRRFKGLESAVVILWQPMLINESERGENLYVGMTRAKSLLVLVGTQDTIDGLSADAGALAISPES